MVNRRRNPGSVSACPRRHRAEKEVRLDQFLHDIQSNGDLRVLGLERNIQRTGNE